MGLYSIQTLKPEIRVVGIDDGQFIPQVSKRVLIAGVVYRGGYVFEGIMHTSITVDGLDATEKISKMILDSPHYKQLRFILLYGITFGGFNIVDIHALNNNTTLPVIVVSQKQPNLLQIKKALKNLPDFEKRWNMLLDAGEILSIKAKRGNKKLFVGIAGLSKELAQKVLTLTSTQSNLPEALRVAHLIASEINLS